MLFYHIPSKKATPFVLRRGRKPNAAKTEGRAPLRRSEMRLLPSAAAVVVAATAAAIVQPVAVVTAAAEQEMRMMIHQQPPKPFELQFIIRNLPFQL